MSRVHTFITVLKVSRLGLRLTATPAKPIRVRYPCNFMDFLDFWWTNFSSWVKRTVRIKKS